MAVTTIAAAGQRSPAAVEDVIYDAVADAIEVVGPDHVAATTALDDDQVDALTAGDRPSLTLEAVETVLDAADQVPAAGSYAADLRDATLIWMGDAVIDITELGARLDTDPTALRRGLDGDRPLTVAEFASIVATVKQDR
ncbi:MAG: DUF5791 family protein [Halobacteriaceae archaeon]